MKITDLTARSILSSQGNETVEAGVYLTDGREVRASIPAGISAGKYEVKKVPVEIALTQIKAIKDLVVGRELTLQEVDKILISADMGGNASLAVSAAWWKAGLKKNTAYTKWPKLFLLLFEGGEHGRKSIAMQEFAVIENSVEEAKNDYEKLFKYLRSLGKETLVGVGAEGGFSPEGFDDQKVLETIKDVFSEKRIAIDAAGSWQGKGIDYGKIIEEFNAASIEDPYSDDEWEKWEEFYTKYASKILVVGDDLTVTNVERMRRALQPRVINAVVIKPNQIGTMTQAIEAVKLAADNQLATVVSHRGDDTDDDWIVDFALETGADYVKFGGIDRGERIAKYNRLRELGMK